MGEVGLFLELSPQRGVVEARRLESGQGNETPSLSGYRKGMIRRGVGDDCTASPVEVAGCRGHGAERAAIEARRLRLYPIAIRTREFAIKK